MTNISNLPFVKNHGKGENKKLTFWNTKPNGNYGDECIIGKAYAQQTISYMEAEDLTPLLGWIVLAIQEKPNHSGIEVGFMSVIAQYAVFGAQKARGDSHA